ncbi:PKD domain-containing protein [Actinokineospora sp.]|uniref:PKD domain-containing protein n=1 Tax=Actinokineospora sp. TaxID=1872133 RepID=UPI003D6AA700
MGWVPYEGPEHFDHTYARPGSYTVTVTARSTACDGTSMPQEGSATLKWHLGDGRPASTAARYGTRAHWPTPKPSRLIDDPPRRCGWLVASRDPGGPAPEPSADRCWSGFRTRCPARRVSPWCGSKEARAPTILKSDMPAAVLHPRRRRSGSWQ